MEIKELVKENNRRRKMRLESAPRGEGEWQGSTEEGLERMARDFKFWAEQCVRIRHKETGEMVPFVLNRAQERVLSLFERERLAGRPIRVIMVKARQWGGSTLVLLYMAWIQLFKAENWHSLVCAHVKDAAMLIRGNYTSLLAEYPERWLPEGVKLVPFEGMKSVRLLTGRGCRIAVGSSETPDSMRGGDYSMAHLSEVAYWADTPGKTPAALVQAICGSIPRVPLSMVVMESTANGTGNYFHREWLKAQDGKSDKIAVFVPWYENDLYEENPLRSAAEVWEALTPYEKELWNRGLTLEQIWWYHCKSMEMDSPRQMMMEYPSSASEAFSNSQLPVFDPRYVERLRASVCNPQRRYMVNPQRRELVESASGELEVWAEPCEAEDCSCTPSYIVSVDVGGNWSGADWSVVAVFDVRRPGVMELVAQWRGHIDMDRLGRVAEIIGRRYHHALLVVESNSLESRGMDVLERLAASGYRNLYRRQCLDAATGGVEFRYGFHTNVATKYSAISDLTALMRDGLLMERSAGAVEELAIYRRQANGGMSAPAGCHDDMVMTRAIAAYALRQQPPRAAVKFPKFGR